MNKIFLNFAQQEKNHNKIKRQIQNSRKSLQLLSQIKDHKAVFFPFAIKKIIKTTGEAE